MLRTGGWRRSCLMAPWGKGTSLFLLLLFLPSSEVPQYFCCREDTVRTREGSAVQRSFGAFMNTVGALGTVASSGDDVRERIVDKWDSATRDVCVDKDKNYADFFLTGVNLAAVPSTPEGSTPPMQHSILRAVQLQRWRLRDQISPIGFSLVSGLTSALPLGQSPGTSEKRRLAAVGLNDASVGGPPGDGSSQQIPDGRPPDEGDPEEDPPRPPEWPLSLTDALYYYIPFVAGYITLMGLGIFALLLAIPMLALQTFLPRSRWKSTGLLVNMFCFPTNSFSRQKTPESGSVTGSHGKVLDTVTARAGGHAQDGVGSEATLCKGLSVVSEEAVTQSEAEMKATERRTDPPQEQHVSSEGYGANAPAADSVAQSNRTGGCTPKWTGQNTGLLLLVVLLFSVLVCVSLGFAYTAQIHQALHAFQCALTAAVAQVFTGAGSGRESVDNVLSKWSSLTLPPPDDLTDAKDYVPASPEYTAALRSLFTSGKVSENRVNELVQRFSGSEVEFTGSPVGEGLRDASHSPRRHLAALDDDTMDSDDNLSRTETEEAGENRGQRGDPTTFLTTLFDFLKGVFVSEAEGPTDAGDGTDQGSEDEESEDDEEEETLSLKRSSGTNRRPDFGGILPLLQVLRRLQEMTDSDSPIAFSNIAAKVFAKGVTLDYLLLSLYDHTSALEELLEAIPVPSNRSARFDHVSLARITVLPFIYLLNEMIPEMRDLLRNGHIELHKATHAMTKMERQVARGFKELGGYEEAVNSAGETVQQALKQVSWFRNNLLPWLLYVVGAFVTFLVVGSVLYLMHLNRQSVKTWESGELHPGPSACLWWFLLVVGGTALFLGAALMTLGVVTMDGCIFVATTVQNPQVLEQVFLQRQSNPAAPKLDNIISACLGRANNRDLSALLQTLLLGSSAPTSGHPSSSPGDIRQRLHTQLAATRKKLGQLGTDELLVNTVVVLTALLDIMYDNAGIYLIKADVRSDVERTAPAAYYSGIQDYAVEFSSIFNLPRAEFIGPEGVRRGDLLPLPLSPMQATDLHRFYLTRRDHPLTRHMLTLLDENAEIQEKMKAAVVLLGEGTVRGRYRLYGLKDMQNTIEPLYFGVFAANNEGRDPRLMVDDNSVRAREYTQRILLQMPQEQRTRVGEAVELARRKVVVRPGRSFTCIRRVGYTSEERRHVDKGYIEELAQIFRTRDPSDVEYNLPDWTEATSTFSTVGDASGRRREHVPCTYEEHTRQLRTEAVQAVFPVTNLYSRLKKTKEEIGSLLFGRADALEDYVGALQDNVDCTPVYRSLLTTQHVVCRDVTERVTLLGITWLFTSLLAIILFIVFFGIWRYLTERYFRRQEAEKARLNALREAEKAAEDARRAHEERVSREEAAAAAAAANAARAEARARQVSAAALNRARTSMQRAQSASGSRLHIHSTSFTSGGGARDMLAARDQGDSVEDTMWADTALD